MSRRDTVIIAVLVNVAFLSLLFLLATKGGTDEEVAAYSEETSRMHVITAPEPEVVKPVEPARDEIDQVLRAYAAMEAPKGPPIEQRQPVIPVMLEPEPIPVAPKPAVMDVVVKRGDSLDKIARAHGSSVKSIMKANNLTSARIDIGQVLKVPSTGEKPPIALAAPKISSDTVEYYTLKSGDNPWKVAKQFRVRFDQLLDLNGLDEEKARNLKPGDTLRVK